MDCCSSHAAVLFFGSHSSGEQYASTFFYLVSPPWSTTPATCIVSWRPEILPPASSIFTSCTKVEGSCFEDVRGGRHPAAALVCIAPASRMKEEGSHRWLLVLHRSHTRCWVHVFYPSKIATTRADYLQLVHVPQSVPVRQQDLVFSPAIPVLQLQERFVRKGLYVRREVNTRRARVAGGVGQTQFTTCNKLFKRKN